MRTGCILQQGMSEGGVAETQVRRTTMPFLPDPHEAVTTRELCTLDSAYAKNLRSETQESTARHYGYKDTVDFGQGLTEFVEANFWAFQKFARALAMSEGSGGATDDLRGPVKILEIGLECARNSRTLNPACRFVMGNHRWLSIDELKNDAELSARTDVWKHTAPLRKRMLERVGKHPLFNGLCMLVFHVHPIHISMVYYDAHFHPPPDSPLGMSLQPGRNTAIPRSFKSLFLDDTIAFTKASINADMALQRTGDDTLQVPLPGRYVRKDRAWVWEVSFSNWEAFLEGGHTCREVEFLKDTISGFESRYSISTFLVLVVGCLS